jgi:uncharacterized protein (TIGR02246 family)
MARFNALLLALAALSACLATATAEIKIVGENQDEGLKAVAGLFDQWNAALATGDPEKVADMYAEESVLLPTLSNTPRTDRAGKVDYFTDFLAKGPQGVIDVGYVRYADDDKLSAMNSGVYTFTFKDGSKAQARYTYVYKVNPTTGKWEIVEHHSSKMPENMPFPDPLDEVRGLFEDWNAALATGNPEAVADMYADNAEFSMLLPTVSNIPRTDRAGKVDYFTEFLKKQPSGVIDQTFARFISDDHDTAINSGIYTFTFNDGSAVQARFSYVYKYFEELGKWLIVEHHSSAMPEAAPKAEGGHRRLLL